MKLVFLENDIEIDSSVLNHAKRNLSKSGLFSVEDLNKIEVVTNFNYLSEDKAFEILFNKENIILTYSMYIDTSGYQLLDFLNYTGKQYKKGYNYIDCSGELLETLINNLHDWESLVLLNAIETNNVLTWVPEDFCIKRIRVKLSGKDKSPFILETIDNNYFNNPTAQQNDETYIS